MLKGESAVILVLQGRGGLYSCLKTSAVMGTCSADMHLGDTVDKLALGVTCPEIGSPNPVIRKAVESE